MIDWFIGVLIGQMHEIDFLATSAKVYTKHWFNDKCKLYVIPTRHLYLFGTLIVWNFYSGNKFGGIWD